MQSLLLLLNKELDEIKDESLLYEQYLFEQVSNKKLILNSIVQRSEGWYKARNSVGGILLTASVFGDICGVSLYSDPYLLFMKLTKRSESSSSSLLSSSQQHLDRGVLFEDEAIKEYERIRRVKVHSTGLWIHPTISYLGGSPDGIIYDESQNDRTGWSKMKGIIEVKCPERKHHYQISDSYQCQIQGYMEILDVDYCDFISYLTSATATMEQNESRLVIWRVKRSREYWSWMLKHINSFYAHLMYDEMPARGKGLNTEVKPRVDMERII